MVPWSGPHAAWASAWAMNDGEPSFWEFSLQIYPNEGVEAACLTLQDDAGADVNLLLLCCFVARYGVRLTPEAMETLARQASAWQLEVVGPLRAVRRRLKQPVGGVLPEAAAPLRKALQDVELEAERLEQDVLQAVLRTLGGLDGREADRPGLARHNLLEYLRHLGVSPDPSVRTALERLIAGCFPQTAR